LHAAYPWVQQAVRMLHAAYPWVQQAVRMLHGHGVQQTIMAAAPKSMM